MKAQPDEAGEKIEPTTSGELFTPNEIATELHGFAVVRAEALRRTLSAAAGPIDAVVRAVKRTG